MYCDFTPAKLHTTAGRSVYIFLAVTFVVGLFGFPAEALIAGAAKVDITPPIGAPLNGYGYRMGRGSVEVHDPLWARALYLEDDDTRLVIVSVDLCLINRELRQAVVARKPDFVEADNIVLVATHNHSGTGGMARSLIARSISGPFRPDLLELTADGIVASMHAAFEARTRAAMGYGTTTQQVLSKNRRFDDGPMDEQLGVLRVDDSDGNAIAIVANFAAHPTTISDEYAYTISADFPGFFYTELEKLSNPGCVAIFLNGAEGNQQCGNPEGATGWAHTESIGRLLAVRTKSLANAIVGKEAVIDLRVSRPDLPASLAHPILPDDTILQSLQIDDLVMDFIPGEPCVEIGLELRRRALTRGNKAHFTVGLSNDHLMYFVPRALYGKSIYENMAHFYGPNMEFWLYREFAALTGATEDPRELSAAPRVETLGAMKRVTLAGSPYDIGYQRGLAFRDELRSLWHERIVDPARDGSLVPDEGLWAVLPGIIDHAPLALLRLAIGARTLLDGVDESVYEEITGMADAAGLPFDALWLLQCNPEYLNEGQMESLYRAPLCTMIAAVGDRAGADRVLIGRNLDWPRVESPVIVETRASDARSYVQVGFPWNAGVYTGLNDAGVAVAVERDATAPMPSFDIVPAEFVLRRVLREARNVESAIMIVEEMGLSSGYKVLLADRGGSAIVVEMGEELRTRQVRSGLLAGTDPSFDGASASVIARYSEALSALKDERIVSIEEMQVALSKGSPSADDDRAFNKGTVHSVVLAPRSGVLYVAVPDGSGSLSEYERVSIGDGAR